MCGIVGYLGHRNATEIIIDSLKRLEYRGYDSAGIAIYTQEKIVIIKTKGKIGELEKRVKEVSPYGNLGIGHTRWATHGKPSDINAHPHKVGKIILVHNGIIENYKRLKNILKNEGISFSSETDTEVITALIHKYYNGNLEEAVFKATEDLEGSYALAVIAEGESSKLVGYRKDSPLILGIGEGEFFLASDIPAILPYTRNFIPLDDNEMVVITKDNYKILKGEREVKKEIVTVNWDPVSAEKGGFKHFMLKEIFEQPRAIADTTRGMYSFEDKEFFIFKENGGKIDLEKIKQIRKVFLVACGTSYHASLTSRYWFEGIAGIEAETDIASEFRYRNIPQMENVLSIFVSQSGETIDTLQALRKAKELGSITVGVVNVIGSTIAREADIVIYTNAGPEIGVASTKAFTSQLAALLMLTLYIGTMKNTISIEEVEKYYQELLSIPRIMEDFIPVTSNHMEKLASKFLDAKSFLYLGRNLMYPIALEGALKLKEISYIHAEGYPAGEMKHGPIALIDSKMPVVILAPYGKVYEKTKSNVEEVISRDGITIIFTDENNNDFDDVANFVFKVPRVSEVLKPFLYVVPLQLFAYHVANKKGLDVDQPRNLAKSVTVE